MVFFIFVIPYTYDHMSKAYLAVTIVLVIFVLSMLSLTAFRDPGFYPRSPLHSDIDIGYVYSWISVCMYYMLMDRSSKKSDKRIFYCNAGLLRRRLIIILMDTQ